MNKLAHYTFLNTRPADQAEGLSVLLQQEGARVITLPTLEIEGPTNPEGSIASLVEFDHCDYAIFVSANAVNFAKQYWKQSTSKIIAIGDGTAKALDKAGFTTDLLPTHFSSEGLLELPELMAPHAKKIIIFCGDNGRKFLADTLSERGALVKECYCYSRSCPSLDSAQLHALIGTAIDLIISTSAESLNNLVHLLGVAGKTWLVNTQLLVISPAMRELAQQLGFQKPILVAKNPSNTAIVEALIFSKNPR